MNYLQEWKRAQYRKARHVYHEAQRIRAVVQCTSPEFDIFQGVTTDEPEDNVSYVGRSFIKLMASPVWKFARVTFCGALLTGHDVQSARLYTLKIHGIQ